MKFKFIKKVEGEVGVYDGKSCKTGDEVEFEGRYAEKALNNPDFETEETEEKETEEKETEEETKTGFFGR